MRTSRRFRLAFIVLATVFGGETAFGASFRVPFPVTNTRYGAAAATGTVLASNGRELFAFWSSGERVRVTRVRDDDRRIGRVVAIANQGFGVVWTGTHFLLVSAHPPNVGTGVRITAQKLDANATPIGRPIVVATEGVWPRIAVSRKSVFVAYQDFRRTRVFGQLLTLDGQPRRSVGAPMYGRYYQVASNGDDFMVVTTSHDDGVTAWAIDDEGATRGTSALGGPLGTPYGHTPREIAIGSDGTGYFAVWDTVEGDVDSVRFDRDGALGTPRRIDAGSRPAVLWTGSGWIVSYRFGAWRDRDFHVTSRFLYLDDEEFVIGRENRLAGIVLPVMTMFEGRVVTALTAGESDAVSVLTLPQDGWPSRVVTFAPADQLLLAAASSRASTLFVWQEMDTDATIHLGMRGRNGDWTERDLRFDFQYAMAASDGSGFVVAFTSSAESLLLHLDDRGNAQQPPIQLSGKVLALASNGSSYAWIDDAQRGWLLDRSGHVTGPLAIDGFIRDGMPALASDGNGFLLTAVCSDGAAAGCAPGLHAVRLSAALRRVGDNVHVAQRDLTNIGVVWTGSAYVAAAHVASGGTLLARIPADPAGVVEWRLGANTGRAMSMVATMEGDVAIGHQGGRTATVFHASGESTAMALSATPNFSMRLLKHPDGNLAYAASMAQDEAPHHGARRVMMAIATAMPRPEAPQLTVRRNGLQAELEWMPGAGPVNGYRVEYKIGDGSWNEVEQWFGAHELSTRRPLRPNVPYFFRVRAFNDAGTSFLYSNVVGVNFPRTRSVR